MAASRELFAVLHRQNSQRCEHGDKRGGEDSFFHVCLGGPIGTLSNRRCQHKCQTSSRSHVTSLPISVYEHSCSREKSDMKGGYLVSRAGLRDLVKMKSSRTLFDIRSRFQRDKDKSLSFRCSRANI